MGSDPAHKRYDVIIAGAGPGGATAAFFLGQAGKKVLVLEKEVLPRYKPCGGGLSKHLLEQFPFSFEPVIESRVCGVTYALRDDDAISIPLPDRSIQMVMRDNFDAYILSRAQAEVKTGAPVRHVEELPDKVLVTTRSGETYEASYLIGSDGANSLVARLTGLYKSRRLPAAIEIEARVPPDVLQRFRDQALFVFGEAGFGYLWIFPKSDHLSIGIGSLHPKAGRLQEDLKRVMSRYGISLDDQEIHGHPLPIYLGPRKISTRRILLVGDAAGLMDPLTGEGIRFAVVSGKLAADAILAGKPGSYSSRVFWKIGFSHLFALPLAVVFYILPDLCFYLGACNPYATRSFVDLLSGKTSYPAVIFRLFASLPLFFVRTIWELVRRR